MTDYAANRSKATGFHFADATAKAFDKALETAVSTYKTPRIWSRIRSNALKRDSSWDASAKTYAEHYEALGH